MGMVEINGQHYLDARASDPRELGWMRGAPPPADKRITFESGTFRDFPHIRWSFSHMRELMPTANVWRGLGMPSQFEHSDKSAEIDALTFADTNGRTRRFDDALFDTYTDGIVVLHRGRIVYERYFGALEPHLPHECQSCTKSYAGTLTAVLVHEGVLDESKMISYYLPELQGTAWEDATLRQVMDMQTGLAFRENYVDEQSDLWTYRWAFGRLPRPAGYDGPRTSCDYLRTVHKQGSHGEFVYQSLNTQVMAWVIMRVTGRSFVQLLQDLLWGPLGCEQDGYVEVDPAGMPTAEGGLSATLRDFARFGEMMRCEGEWHGKQLIPASVVRDVREGTPNAKLESGYSYRSQWWVSHDELGSFEARGIHGQRLYIAPKVEMVVARFASHPIADGADDPATRPQLLALGRMLRT
ncbi:MAG: class C beta-lactamase-related serine hydrolase [Mesorhizobium sp.]|uniref:serine hydrolase domain-containing protein n=1 Tax=Mesorhizobium sp. TaxID=1871066 RepID=UPI000FE84B24|nr:MAG: class C beta-lactamase-related serine hydrolase [Mesorhizobium sp.]